MNNFKWQKAFKNALIQFKNTANTFRYCFNSFGSIKLKISNRYYLQTFVSAWNKLKERLKSISRKTAPVKLEERIAKIKEVQPGWLNYFRGTSIMGKLRDLDGWLRNRLRYCIWHDWKKPERKRKNLIRLGVDQGHAYAFSRTRKGGWAIAQSPILGTTITLKRLKQRGYQSLTDVYIELNPSLCEPPNT